MINNHVMLEVHFDNGVRLYMKPEMLEPEAISREEIMAIEKKNYTPAERAKHLANRVIKDKNILGKINSLDQLEKDIKNKLEDIKNDRKKLLEASRKIEEAARRLTKIKALGDNAIITEINDSVAKDI